MLTKSISNLQTQNALKRLLSTIPTAQDIHIGLDDGKFGNSVSEIILPEGAQTTFHLPSERSFNHVQGQGWTIDTTVKSSRIEGAGNGRFANVDVPKNTRVLFKSLISMENISSILTVPNDSVILFKNEYEIERFIKQYEDEGNQERDDVIQCLAHFIWSLEDLSGAALCFSTWSMNHGDPGYGENIRFFENDGLIIGESVTDIKAGDELCNDYRDFKPIPEFWTAFCKKHGYKDVLANLAGIIE